MAVKKIICDLCEGTEFIKKDGMFVCQGCGTKYSLEEAKSIMRNIEGEETFVIETSPTMPMCNPSQSQIDSILAQATKVFEAQNYIATENYCNRAIALDATCYMAWSLKGRAVGRQSKANSIRIGEVIHSFSKAIDFAPTDEKEEVKKQALIETRNTGIALITLHKNRFSSCPSEKELDLFISDKESLLNGLQVLLSNGNLTITIDDYLEEVATLMYEAGVAAFVKAEKTWANLKHPTHKDLSTHLEWNTNICEIFRQSIAMSSNDERNIVRYRNLINALRTPVGRYSQIRQWDSFSEQYEWIDEYSLDDDATSFRVREAFECENTIKMLEKRIVENRKIKAKKLSEEKQARIKAYWEAHADEKNSLENEKKQLVDEKKKLSSEVAELDKEIRAVEEMKNYNTPYDNERVWIEERIRDLDIRRSKLGLLAGRERKQISEEISALENQLLSLKDKIEQEKAARYVDIERKLVIIKNRKNELNEQLSAATARIVAIDADLTNVPIP